jgi:hypothetical protein
MDGPPDPQVRVELRGSALPAPAGARRLGPAADETRTVSVYLRDGPPAERDEVTAALARAGFQVDPGPGPSLRVTGTLPQLASYFGTSVSTWQDPSGATFEVPDASLRVPSSLAAAVVGVFGFDTRPAAGPRAG